MALYELIRAGYSVNAFIHDEFILTIRDDADWNTVPRDIERIVCEQMQSVCGSVPIAAEGVRMKRWFKNAKPVWSNEGELLVWEPRA